MTKDAGKRNHLAMSYLSKLNHAAFVLAVYA